MILFILQIYKVNLLLKQKSPNHQRKVIQTFIKAVIVHNDDLEIHSIMDTMYGGEPR